MNGALKVPAGSARQVRFHAALPVLAIGLWRNRFILKGIVRNEVFARYRNTVLGMLWSLVNPLLMILVYSYVFGLVFKVRFGTAPEHGAVPYGIVLFSGLILHVLVAETLMRAQSIVLDNPNYVKRVVFPLEVLPVAILATNLFHALTALAVLFAVILAYGLALPWTALLLPVVWAPFLLIVLGLALLVASLGVFVRDIGQILGFLMTILLFGSSILFPPELLPEAFRPWLLLNPLTVAVDATRDVLLWGRLPDWSRLGVYAAVSMFVSWFGAWWFMRTQRGFAEVM